MFFAQFSMLCQMSIMVFKYSVILKFMLSSTNVDLGLKDVKNAKNSTAHFLRDLTGFLSDYQQILFLVEIFVTMSLFVIICR